MTRLSHRRLPWVALLLSCMAWIASTPPCAGDDFGTWHSIAVKTFDTETVDLVTFAQLRFRENSSELGLYQLSQQILINAHKNLGFGLHYSFLPSRRRLEAGFVDQHRLELEATPRWPVTERLTLDFRNRLELRWTEGRPERNERTRHRLQAAYRLPFAGIWRSIYANNEIFYDFDRNALTENRLIPLGLGFKLHPQVNLSLYYLLQSAKAANSWGNNHILGTHIYLGF